MIAVVSGPPGSGKSAHALAERVGIPAIIRDEIKQGRVTATAPTRDGHYDDLNIPVLHAFFDVLTVLRSQRCQHCRRSRVPGQTLFLYPILCCFGAPEWEPLPAQ